MKSRKTAGPRRLIVNRARRAQLQGVVSAVEALGVRAGEIVAIRCDAIDAPAAEYLLAMVRDYLEDRGLEDTLVLLMPGERFEFAAIDEAEMERWGWVRQERSSGADSAQLRAVRAATQELQEKYRLVMDDLAAGIPVDPAAVRSALSKLLSEINRVWPDDLASAA